jgi:hypothetical protein
MNGAGDDEFLPDLNEQTREGQATARDAFKEKGSGRDI